MAEAGLALAILPLLLSTLDHFQVIRRPVVRYRHFDSRLERFRKVLDTQRCIYREEIFSLVLAAEGANSVEKVEKMLQEPQNPLRNDGNLNKQLDNYLGASRDSCVDTVDMIRETLRKLEDEIIELEKATGKGSEPVDDALHLHVHKKVKKLKFSFSESELSAKLMRLKELNRDFLTLTGQVRIIAEQRTAAVTMVSRSHQDMKQFRLVQRASKHLYEALRVACTKHTEHQAHLSLQVRLNGDDSGSSVFDADNGLKFNMAFQLGTTKGTSTADAPIWLTIHSKLASEDVVSFQADGHTAFSERGKSFKRKASMPSATPRTVREVAGNHSRRSDPLPKHVGLPLIGWENLGPNDADKPTNQNFCNRIQQHLRQNTHATRFICYLEESVLCKHRVYLRSAYASPGTLNIHQQKSLADMIGALSKDSTAIGLPKVERIHLAKVLSTAVLQLHTTPWLKETWRSDDVLFSVRPTSTEMTKTMINLAEPYIKVSISSTRDESSTSASQGSNRRLECNHILFGLGVMLLELAFEMPLRAMQRQCDLLDGPQSPFVEYLTATRISSTTSSKLGSRYSEVVRKCLYCDFGEGHDLDKRDLQKNFHRDVVCELDYLEANFRDLGL